MSENEVGLSQILICAGEEVYAGNYKKALDCANEALKRKPQKVKDKYYTHEYKGEALHGLGEYQEAIIEFDYCFNLFKKERVIPPEINAKIRQTLRFRGVSYQKLKRYSKALENFNLMYSIDPNKISGLIERGELYLEIENFDKATESVKEYLSKIKKIPNKQFFVDVGEKLLNKITSLRQSNEDKKNNC